MGHPAAPLMPLLLLALRPAAPCFTVPSDAPAELRLTNRSHQCTELDWGLFQRQNRLWLNRNGIEALTPSSRVEPTLENLDLSYNRLRELPDAFLSRAQGLRCLQLQHNLLRDLPDGFFANATALQELWLQGNPLPAVPGSAFVNTLRYLAVPCRCDVAGSVLGACSRPESTALRCQCFTSQNDSFNVTDFHARECWGNVGLVAGTAGAAGGAAVVLAIAAVVCYRRRKAAGAAAGAGWGKRDSAVAHGQPRYISRAAEIGAADATAAAPDYENIFVNPCAAPAAAQGWTPEWQEQRYRPQVPVDDDYFLESEAVSGDQPIYANTQTPGDDSVYIIPNHC